MIVVTDHRLDGAGQQFILGVHPGLLRLQLDVEAFILEITEVFRQLGRQVDQLVDAADHDGDLAVGGLGRRWDSHAQQRSGKQGADDISTHIEALTHYDAS